MVADTSNYRGRATLDRVIWSVSPEFTTAVTRLFSGDADLFDALRPENVRQLAGDSNLKTIALPGMDYAFLRFNLRDPANRNRPHPLFADRKLRRAITMSLNREHTRAERARHICAGAGWSCRARLFNYGFRVARSCRSIPCARATFSIRWGGSAAPAA